MTVPFLDFSRVSLSHENTMCFLNFPILSAHYKGGCISKFAIDSKTYLQTYWDKFIIPLRNGFVAIQNMHVMLFLTREKVYFLL